MQFLPVVKVAENILAQIADFGIRVALYVSLRSP
jgi:hypothetical protein